MQMMQMPFGCTGYQELLMILLPCGALFFGFGQLLMLLMLQEKWNKRKPVNMNIKLIIIIALSYLYGIFEIILGIRQRQRRKRNIVIKGDKGSFWLLLILIAVGYTLSFCFAATRIGRIYHWDAFFAIGAIVILVGLIIRITAIMTLQQHFTYTVTKIENHELIESGLYKSIRHPGYLGQIIVFIGTLVSLSNWLSVLSMIIPILFGFIYRIRVEEKFMIEQMGEKYIDYQKRTKRLIPTIY